MIMMLDLREFCRRPGGSTAQRQQLGLDPEYFIPGRKSPVWDFRESIIKATEYCNIRWGAQ